MSLKDEFVCSICAKIFKDPVCFPCICTMCAEHLHEPDVQSNNQIACATCSIEYSVSDTEFKPNKLVDRMLRQDLHLSPEEKSLKLKLGQGIDDLQQLCDELLGTKSSFEVDVDDHFAEIRRQIDIRYEETRGRLDAIYMQMIDITKKTEAQFMEYSRLKTITTSGQESLNQDAHQR